MTGSESHSETFRFGPFEFRPQQGELRKSGRILKLQPQPARLLEILVSNAGQVVKREQIQSAIWDADTQVAYELGVNRCIRQIRSVLLDDPDTPRYIRTLPRQGYSFIAEIERVSPSRRDHDVRGEPATTSLELVTPAPPLAAPVPTIPEINQTVSLTSKPSKGIHKIQSWILLLGCILIALGVAQYLARPLPAPKVDSYTQLSNDSYDKVLKTGALARPLFSDGSRVYFSVMSGAAVSEIAQVAVNGGDTSIVSTPLPNPVLFDYSPSRSQFLLGSGTGIRELPVWIQPLPSGSAHRLSEISAYGASWSPDGEQLVYGSGNGLYIASGSGSNSRLIATFDKTRSQRAYWPRWSPDARSIRFSIYDGATRSSWLAEISPQGGELKHLFPRWSFGRDSCCGTWTSDGRLYVFVSSRGGRDDLWLSRTKTGLEKLRSSADPIQLTDGPLSYSAPLPNKDGTVVETIGGARRAELMIFDSTSNNFAPLTSRVSPSQADISRDGKRLAFVSSSDGSLWRSNVDGTEQRQLSFPPLQVKMPRWSPDGSQISFHGHNPSGPLAVYVASEKDGQTHQLAGDASHDASDPDWSADGREIVFSNTSLPDQASVLQIVNVETGKTSDITGSAGLRSPRWSLDGRHISALTNDLNTLMVFDVYAKTWKRLTAFRMGYPNWSHDSRFIYVVSLAHSPAIVRVRVADGRIEPIVDMGRRNQYWTDDAWLGLTPSDVPMVSRDSSIEQVFALHCSIQ